MANNMYGYILQIISPQKQEMKVRAILFQLFLCVGFIGSCNSKSLTNSNETSPPLAEEVKPTQKVTFTKGPTWTQRPIVTQTPTITPTLIPSPSPIPTLTDSEQENYLVELFEENDNCTLPCWWGLHPSETTWSNVQNVLGSLGAKYYESIYGISKRYPNLGLVSVHAWENNLILDNLQITLKAYLENSKGYELNREFSLEKTLSQFGEPSRILIHSRTATADPGGDGTMDYELWVFFEEKGILIAYTGGYKLPKYYETSYQLCFSYQDIQTIIIFLQSSKNERAVEDLVSLVYSTRFDISGKLASKKLKPLEEVNGMTIEEFYKKMVTPDDSMCIEVPTGFD